MAKEQQGQVEKTLHEGSASETEGIEGGATGGANSLEDDPIVQEMIQREADRRISMLQKKWAREREDLAKQAEEKARREAQEAKLLEDGKLQELADLRAKEAQEAKQKLAEYEHRDKVNMLLDKKNITDPAFRSVFLSMACDLSELDERVDAFMTQISAAVDKSVNERLHVDQPAKTGKEAKPKPISEMTPEEWQAHKKTAGVY